MHRVITDFADASFETLFPSARLALVHARAAETEGGTVLVLDPEHLLLYATDEPDDHP